MKFVIFVGFCEILVIQDTLIEFDFKPERRNVHRCKSKRDIL